MKRLLLALALVVGLQAQDPFYDPNIDAEVLDIINKRGEIFELNNKLKVKEATAECFVKHPDISSQVDEIYELITFTVGNNGIDSAPIDIYEKAIILFHKFRNDAKFKCKEYNDYAIARAFAKAGNHRVLVYDIIMLMVEVKYKEEDTLQ